MERVRDRRLLISSAILTFARPRKLGKVLGADGMQRMVPGLVRVPDVSFFASGKAHSVPARGHAGRASFRRPGC